MLIMFYRVTKSFGYLLTDTCGSRPERWWEDWQRRVERTSFKAPFSNKEYDSFISWVSNESPLQISLIMRIFVDWFYKCLVGIHLSIYLSIQWWYFEILGSLTKYHSIGTNSLMSGGDDTQIPIFLFRHIIIANKVLI